jgi:hypothetical protein
VGINGNLKTRQEKYMLKSGKLYKIRLNVEIDGGGINFSQQQKRGIHKKH